MQRRRQTSSYPKIELNFRRFPAASGVRRSTATVPGLLPSSHRQRRQLFERIVAFGKSLLVVNFGHLVRACQQSGRWRSLRVTAWVLRACTYE